MPSPFDFSKSINEQKYSFEDIDKNAYSQYIVNKIFSFYPDTIFLANEANMYPEMEPKQHYDFLFHTVSKKQRYSKWVKQNKDSDILELSEKLNMNYDKMVEIVSILSDDELKKLKASLETGGT